MRGFGGIVSFLHAGGEAGAVAMVARTRIFTLAESLGAVESLIEHPARMTHAVLAQSPLAVDPALVRLSVGIENIDDLLADLDQALRGLMSASSTFRLRAADFDRIGARYSQIRRPDPRAGTSRRRHRPRSRRADSERRCRGGGL